MVDFAKLRAANAAKAASTPRPATPQVMRSEPSIKDRCQHLVREHLGEMSEWEANFCYSQIEYGIANPGTKGTPKIREKLADIESNYCGQGCKD